MYEKLHTLHFNLHEFIIYLLLSNNSLFKATEVKSCFKTAGATKVQVLKTKIKQKLKKPKSNTKSSRGGRKMPLLSIKCNRQFEMRVTIKHF